MFVKKLLIPIIHASYTKMYLTNFRGLDRTDNEIFGSTKYLPPYGEESLEKTSLFLFLPSSSGFRGMGGFDPLPTPSGILPPAPPPHEKFLDLRLLPRKIYSTVSRENSGTKNKVSTNNGVLKHYGVYKAFTSEIEETEKKTQNEFFFAEMFI